jgi:hypothetical protein
MWSPANAGTLLRAIYVKIIAVRIASIPPHRRHTFATGRDAGLAAMCVDQRELVLDDFVTNAAGAVPIWKASPKRVVFARRNVPLRRSAQTRCFTTGGLGWITRGGVDNLKSSRQCGGERLRDKPLRKQPWIKRPFR